MATIVSASADAVQVFALIALIVFGVAAVICAIERSIVPFLTNAGLALLAAALLFLT